MTRPVAPHLSERQHQGFTLIEVMITAAILAILASIAYPAYTDYVRKSQVQEAFANLSSYHNRLEQYYQDNRRYAASSSATTCGGAAASTLTAAELGSEIKYFTYGCVAAGSGQTYTVTAVGSAGAASGNTYTLTNRGARATILLKGATVNLPCWSVNGSC